MLKNFGISLSLAAIGTSIALITLEVVLRIYSVLPGHQSFRRLTNYEFDATIGWVRKRNWTYLRITPDYSVYNYYNAQGLPVTKKEIDQLRTIDENAIVFLGDSFVESYYLDYDKSFPNLFDQCYSGRHVYNLGVSGYSPDQEYLLYQREVKTKIAGVYTFFFPRNDIKNSFRAVVYGGYEKPLFDSDHKNITNLPLSKNESVKKFLVDHSAIFYFLQPLLHKYIGFREDRHDFHQRIERVTYSQEDMSYALKFYEMAKRRNMHRDFFRVIYIPELMELENPTVFQRNLEIFYKICTQQGLECLAPNYLESFNPLREHFYPFDRHFNEAGSRKMANFLVGLEHKYPRASSCK